MRFHGLKYMVLLALAAMLVFPITSCKQGGHEAKKAVIEAITREKEPTLPESAKGLVEREFAGMNLDVTAESARDVCLEPEGGSGAYRDAMVFTGPVFTKMLPGGYKTVLQGENAVVDISRKCVVFDRGATVSGPWGNRLSGATVTWFYGTDELEASDGFTLNNGSGMTQGRVCKTDICFKSIDVQ